MKPSLLLTIFFLAGICLAPVAHGRKAGAETDAHGRPLFDGNGRNLYYSREEILGSGSSNDIAGSGAYSTSSVIIQRPALPEATATLALSDIPPSAGGTPFWAFGIFGTQIGLAGMHPVTTENGVDLFVSATANSGFGANNFWYVLRFNPASASYQQIHVQPPYTPLSSSGDWNFRITSMELANVMGGSEAELIIGLSDGRFFFYSTTNRRQLRSIRPLTQVNDYRAVDLNADGVAELIVTTETELKIFNSSGQTLWSVTGPNGFDLAIAQMDADPALEIATTSGHVVDVSTRSIQWTNASGFGSYLRATDIDNDGRAELIAAERWYYIYAYDVELMNPKWSYRTELDISAIEIANADADIAHELLYADEQHGEVHVLSLGANTPTEEWSIRNPSSGVPRILIADTDNDGARELVWGGGSNTTGSDHLYVADIVTRQVEWESIHLDGPFLSPVLGDLNGDGTLELVSASWESDSGYGSGRILVFDSETLELLAISDPIAENYSWTGLNDLKLRDVDNDGRHEIVVAADWLYDGIIEIYGFTDDRKFELKWTNPNRPDGAPYSQVDVLDVDGDGNLEVVAGNAREHTGSSGTYLTVIDYQTKTTEWVSPHMGGNWLGVSSLAIDDLDGDGRKEALVALGGSAIFVFDLHQRIQEFSVTGDYNCVVTRSGQTGFHAGRANGTIVKFMPKDGRYETVSTWTASNVGITGLTVDGQNLWVSTAGRFYRWPGSTRPDWGSASVGGTVTGRVAIAQTSAATEVYAGLSYGIGAFQVGETVNVSKITLSSSGSLSETSPGEALLRFTRVAGSSEELTVQVELGGTAVPGTDYEVLGATAISGRFYNVTIPTGIPSATVSLIAKADNEPEGREQIHATLLTGATYDTGEPAEAFIDLDDNEPVVTVAASDSIALELRTGRSLDSGLFTLTRGGDTSRPILVRFALEGTARNGTDFRRIARAVIFRKGENTATVRIVPQQDGDAEPEETVQLRILPGASYLVSKSASSASIKIIDGAPAVTISKVTAIPGAMLLSLARSGGHTNAFIVHIAVTRQEANGAQEVTFRRVRFPANQTATGCTFTPKLQATGSATVTVEILDNGNYHIGETPSALFNIQPFQID